MSEFRRIIMSSFLMLLLHFTVTEHQVNDEVTLRCSVKTYGCCRDRVKWLFQGQDVVKDHREIKFSCSASSSGWWWWIIVVIVGVAALTIITVAVIRRKRTQGNETQTDDNVADPEDGASYASISYTRKSSSKARVHDDEDDAVTYSTIKEEAKAKSDRLRVTENCSLVIKKVTEKDVGRYTCRQFRSGEQEDPDTVFDLSVVNMTEHQDNDEVTLNCSVSTYGGCIHPVKWLLQGRDVDTDHREIKTSHPQSSGWWWWIIVVIVGVAALTIITVAVIRRKRTQGNETQTDDNVADPEDGVSYASMSYNRKSSRKARVNCLIDYTGDANKGRNY
ncbi:Pregnancy-specific beta-1-glycoprotein 4 [Dissostichus eleginoides]|uniref:Pregnancy-specific beta-1-glycoprotein 4 n=1 Tax=Dissostichus eleginoides TaxID=100907 RepID=A0AAD9BUU3_DISEL|nr:Pregnancy-specific beta-1-glycoprotein 4 [Dissostichus eleginoides]